MEALIDLFAAAQALLFETLVQPLAFSLGLGQSMELAFEGTGWLLVGLLQLGVMLLVIQPLEWWRPVEPMRDKRAVRSDVIYTLIHRLGVFRLALFFTLDPLADALFGGLRSAGWSGMHLDDLWPGGGPGRGHAAWAICGGGGADPVIGKLPTCQPALVLWCVGRAVFDQPAFSSLAPQRGLGP